uniref:Uncharacterized protein n=1 Tax=Anopheles maculatus TaxID=74869 RepID=A0A182SLX1_9DIPT
MAGHSSSTTYQDREFVELETQYNGQTKRPGSPSPMASPSHSANTATGATGLLQSCCGRCCSQRYQDNRESGRISFDDTGDEEEGKGGVGVGEGYGGGRGVRRRGSNGDCERTGTSAAK